MGALSDLRSCLEQARPVKQSGGGPVPPQESLRAPVELVRAAVAAIPNTSELFPSRESFLDVGYAIRAAVEDEFEAFEIFSEWCARWDMGLNDPEAVANEWSRMPPPFRRGANWLFELAQQHGGYVRGAEYFDQAEADRAVAAEAAAIQVAAGRFKIESLDAVGASALTEATPYLIKGLLDQSAMSVLYGASNEGKTFVEMDMAHAIAAGRPYMGLKVRQGPVLYIAAEGARGFRRRAAALTAKYGPCPDFHVLMTPVNLFDATADIAPLIEAIRGTGVQFVLIVVDTLARAMAGGDENSTKDMAAFVANADAMRRLAGDPHLSLVHHTGKDESRGARGSSVLRAAIDTEIEVKGGQITVTKQRDLDKSWSAAFALEVVELGRDPEGDPITSCTVRLSGGDETAAAVTAGVPTKAEGEVLGALAAVYAEAGNPVAGVPLKEVSDYLADHSSGVKTDTVRSHLRSLLAKRLIRRLNRGRWALKAVDFPSTALKNGNQAVTSEINVRYESGIEIYG